MIIDAIILAGSLNNGQLKDSSSVLYEALIPIGARIMVEYVIDALLKSSKIGKIVVVGPEIELDESIKERIRFVFPGESLLDNAQRGFDCLPAGRRVLVATSDIPLITAEVVDDFINQCQDESADLFYPIVSRDVIQNSFANAERTYVRLQENVFTGGNLILLNPEILPRCLAKGNELVKARKNPLKLSRLIGLSFLIKFVLHKLSLAEAEIKVSKLLGIKGVAVVSPHPAIGLDVDKPSDLSLVTEVLA
ncbi:MAG: nucleotidyltransferase family protein [Eubacteriales bacterium]|jgi:GTP:adenosylcobinamide-phosphate guanylyltransferase